MISVWMISMPTGQHRSQGKPNRPEKEQLALFSSKIWSDHLQNGSDRYNCFPSYSPPPPLMRTKHKVLRGGGGTGHRGWKQGSAYSHRRISLTINNKKAAMQTAWNLVQLTKSQLHETTILQYTSNSSTAQNPYLEISLSVRNSYIYEDHTAHLYSNTALMMRGVWKFKKISSS